MDTNKDYYGILGVLPSMEAEALKAVHRALVKKYHPDTTSSTSTSEIFRDIQEAYDVLSNRELRKIYDRERFKEELKETCPSDEPKSTPRSGDLGGGKNIVHRDVKKETAYGIALVLPPRSGPSL